MRLALLGLVLAVAAGCVTTRPLPPTTILAPASASPEATRWAIEAGLAERRWVVAGHAPGVVDAYVKSAGTGEFVSVEIAYEPGRVTIRQVQWRGSRERHQRWIGLLSAEIRKHLAKIGMNDAGGPHALPPVPASEP
jgi:hypothetical protein